MTVIGRQRTNEDHRREDRGFTDVPMSLADACLVRMTETLADAVVLTTHADFRIYRRHSRQVVPSVLPD